MREKLREQRLLPRAEKRRGGVDIALLRGGEPLGGADEEHLLVFVLRKMRNGLANVHRKTSRNSWRYYNMGEGGGARELG